MNETWKKAALVVASLLIIGVAGYFILRGRTRGRITPDMVNRPRVCEACSHRYDGSTEPLVLECPACHKKATVRVHNLVCRDCGESFAAFRERVTDPNIQKMDEMNPPMLEYKKEGGSEWVIDFNDLGAFKCPKCGSAKVGPPKPK